MKTIYPNGFQRAELNGADFHAGLYEIEKDFNVVDDAFLILIKDYYVDPRQSVKYSSYRVKELIRGDPIFMRIVSDKRGVRGGRYKVCPLHRDQYHIPVRKIIVTSVVITCKMPIMQYGW